MQHTGNLIDYTVILLDNFEH